MAHTAAQCTMEKGWWRALQQRCYTLWRLQHSRPITGAVPLQAWNM